MKKESSFPYRAHLAITLMTLFLISCASTTGPVTIRDSGGEPAYRNSQKGANSPSEKSDDRTDIAILSPVRPDTKKTAVPIIDRLVNQANRQLITADYKKAITTAERGLRINRKEPRLYLALAKAYRGLQNTRQSSYFAKQGLRYAQKGGVVFSQLKNMSN